MPFSNMFSNAGNAMYNSLPSMSGLKDAAYNHIGLPMARAADSYFGNNIASNLLSNPSRQNFMQAGQSLGDYGRDKFRDSLNARLPEHIGSGYGLREFRHPTIPSASVRGTPRYADAFMDSPINTLGEQTGRVLGRYGSNELSMNDMERRQVNEPSYMHQTFINPAIEYGATKVGSGLGWLGQKAMSPFMPAGFQEQTPNQLFGNLGERAANYAFNKFGNGQEFAYGGYAHGGMPYRPTLREMAEMMPMYY